MQRTHLSITAPRELWPEISALVEAHGGTITEPVPLREEVGPPNFPIDLHQIAELWLNADAYIIGPAANITALLLGLRDF
jgi:hypothetical protein